MTNENAVRAGRRLGKTGMVTQEVLKISKRKLSKEDEEVMQKMLDTGADLIKDFYKDVEDALVKIIAEALDVSDEKVSNMSEEKMKEITSMLRFEIRPDETTVGNFIITVKPRFDS
jgi:predicted RecB family endonuclease